MGANSTFCVRLDRWHGINGFTVLGRKPLITLRDAAKYIVKLPEAERELPRCRERLILMKRLSLLARCFALNRFSSTSQGSQSSRPLELQCRCVAARALLKAGQRNTLQS